MMSPLTCADVVEPCEAQTPAAEASTASASAQKTARRRRGDKREHDSDNLEPVPTGVPQRLLIAGSAALATLGALVIDLRNYQTFLFLLGSFFVPLFGVLLADWLLAGRRYDRDDVFAAPEI